MNNIVIFENESIGAVDADYDDEYLFDCFVPTPAFKAVSDVKNRKSFLYGRTGAGKTAAIRYIQKQNKIVSIIELNEISLDYISNSDVIQYLTQLGVDLDILFMTLWRHILCLEYIRVRFDTKNLQKSTNLLRNLTNQFGSDKTKETALKYLEKYSDKFWVESDVHLQELIENFENEIRLEAGGELKKFHADAGYIRKLGTEKKTQLQLRFKKFVNSEILSELNNVMKLLKAYNSDNLKDDIFILIDKIDEEWVEESVRYQLIRALIETQKSFGKIDDLKIVVAIRADIFERVLQETLKPGTQREKFDDQLAKITWSKEQLKKVIDMRIEKMCRDKYTKAAIKASDVFTTNVGQKEPIDYILSRTLYRPRDAIVFVNECLELSAGKSEITGPIIKEAEKKYSPIRVTALENEWVSAVPSIHLLLSLISGRHHRFRIGNLFEKTDFEEFILKISENIEKFPYGPVTSYVRENMKIIEDLATLASLRKLICAELYRVGVLSVKVLGSDRHHYSFKDSPTVSTNQIDDDTKVSIHPAFHIGLSVFTAN